jgi:hypothetical protein
MSGLHDIFFSAFKRFYKWASVVMMDAVFVLEDSSFNDANQGDPPSYETLTLFRSDTG